MDLNATKAAIRAGYSAKTASEIGYENLRKPQIKKLIAEGEAKALAKADLSAQNVLEAIRRHLMRDVRQLVGKDGKFKPLEELSSNEAAIIDKIVEADDGTVKYRIDSLHKWVEMAAKHFSLLTERVKLVDHRHVEDKLIEARERAVKAGHGKKNPDVGRTPARAGTEAPASVPPWRHRGDPRRDGTGQAVPREGTARGKGPGSSAEPGRG